MIFVRKQAELYPHKAKRELVRLSDTHWACRYISVNTVCHMYDAILATLTEIADSDDAAKAVTANGLLSQVKFFSFIIILVIPPDPPRRSRLTAVANLIPCARPN